MIDLPFVLKLIHLLGATVLFGTGLGIAFFMWMAVRSGDPKAIAQVAGIVVVADMVFTATAVAVQPMSGAALAWSMGFSLLEPWIITSVVLYVVVGACWLPVVGIQLRLRDLAVEAASKNAPLSATFHRLFRIWFWLGWPAFAGVIAIFALMIFRPRMW